MFQNNIVLVIIVLSFSFSNGIYILNFFNNHTKLYACIFK